MGDLGRLPESPQYLVEVVPMATTPPTLTEVLYARSYASNPKRAEVTRTIIQPDIDAVEQAELAATDAGKIKKASKPVSGNTVPAG
jgi:hypothetical protein